MICRICSSDAIADWVIQVEPGNQLHWGAVSPAALLLDAWLPAVLSGAVSLATLLPDAGLTAILGGAVDLLLPRLPPQLSSLLPSGTLVWCPTAALRRHELVLNGTNEGGIQ